MLKKPPLSSNGHTVMRRSPLIKTDRQKQDPGHQNKERLKRADECTNWLISKFANFAGACGQQEAREQEEQADKILQKEGIFRLPSVS